MKRQERTELLKNMLFQIAPDDNVEHVARPVREEGLESLEAGPTPAESGVQKLAEGRHQELTNAEMDALEAIILPQNRPVVFVRGDSYDNVDNPWEKLNPPEVKAKIARWFPSIGRIEVPNMPQIPYGGTGFVVGKNLVMTNRHVAKLFSSGLGLKIAYNSGDSAINFQRQVDTGADRSTYADVLGVEMIHPYWDMALLRVADLPDGKILTLSTKRPEALNGGDIIAVGYPAKDWRSDLELQDRIFQNQYNVKRLQPGVLRQRATIRSFENVVNAVTHDASTLGGNSGSAILDANTQQVLALHFAGEYLKANYAVPMYELARDSRVTAKKLNFDGAVTPTNDWEPSWLRTEGTEAAAPPPSPAVPAAPVQSPGPARATVSFAPAVTSPARSPGATVSAAAGSVTWTLPINITVSVGSLQQAVHTPAPGPAEAIAAEEAVVVDQDYSTRPGYDPDFLEDVTVPLPKLTTKAMEQDTAQVRPEARKHKDPYELAYHHYSVYVNKKRRTAWFSAANVDGDNRPDIGSRSGDRWYRDPRILKSEQLGQEAFESGIDRGHLTRREDTAWGEDVDSATAANNDTFHWTNCSLQASHFNRGKDRWQGLEQYLLEKHAKKDKRRMIVITGPLFAPNDPLYQNDKMDYAVRCPLQFWKVCVLIRETDGSPSATGFILNQDEIKDLPGFEETFEVVATQIKISELEKRTKLSFGDLNKHDHFAQDGAAGTLEAPTAQEGVTQTVKLIYSPSDIVV
jgi:DNA/RNA endonuclease G (NUC1)